MPAPQFFARVGLFVVKDFFDEALCARLRSEARSAPGGRARVMDDDGTFAIDERVRRTTRLDVCAATTALVESRLRTLQPMLEKHFDIPLTGCQPPRFLLYTPGDYYHPHPDCSADAQAAPEVKERRISLVAFLNDEAPEPTPGKYCGGALTFFGLFDEPRLRHCGFPLTGHAGLLVGFGADVLHAVTPVTHGERYTIVSWFV
jgi:predicted 2-oxoglutarate/Fe(II)-dependent dioxygenase YbiX